MTVYQFRFKFDPDPIALWRDVHIGADRTLEELQSTINETFGLDNDHQWFIGADESYWHSDVKYLSPQDEDTPAHDINGDDRIETAAETTVGELADQLGIEQYERICYVYDYDNEWRFYAICKAVDHHEPSNMEPLVGKQKGDPLEQYPAPSESTEPTGPTGSTGSTEPTEPSESTEPAESTEPTEPTEPAEPTEPSEPTPSLPEPIDSFPETAVPIPQLAAAEDHDDVRHVISLLTVETESGPVSERFLIQYGDVGYLVEHYPDGWVIVEDVDGTDKSEEELLGELASKTRAYHTKLTKLACAVLDEQFEHRTVKAMNAELHRELDARGYGHL